MVVNLTLHELQSDANACENVKTLNPLSRCPAPLPQKASVKVLVEDLEHVESDSSSAAACKSRQELARK